jgi:glycerophosphoryl diester phosphodiesterase
MRALQQLPRYAVAAWLWALPLVAMADSDPIVIAHRGASGYLPEHTLEAKVLAHAMGADFIEQDVVLTGDGVPVVLHDIYLESTTDVEQRFPERARADGRFYALDFTLAEIRQLHVHERSQRDAAGNDVAVYPQRFPLDRGRFKLPTLQEEIELIAGLDASRGLRTGLYIELKAPVWHASQGHDLAQTVLDVLQETGYAARTDLVYLQCFDDITLKRLRHEFKTPLPLIQLIGENDWDEDGDADYDFMRTGAGLDAIANYASGIGPWIPQLLSEDGNGGWVATGLAALAQQRGLLIHPYTVRADDLPPGLRDVEELHRALFDELGVDGAFTDFPDLTRRFIDARR